MDARGRASLVARLMGTKIMRIKSITIGDVSPIAVARAEFAPGVPIQPGQLELTVTINVAYVIQ